jgi:hypothetical protein
VFDSTLGSNSYFAVPHAQVAACRLFVAMVMRIDRNKHKKELQELELSDERNAKKFDCNRSKKNTEKYRMIRVLEGRRE